jgi:NAD+ kinase
MNEISVSRKETTSMITIETYLNGKWFLIASDGLIATPTGSTDIL